MATSSEIPAIPSEKRNATSRVTTLCEWSRCSLATIRDCIRFVRSNIPDIEYEKTTAPETKTKYTLFVYPSGLQSSRNLKKFKSLPSHFPESLLYQTLALESPLRDEIEIKFTTNFYQSPTKSIPFLLTADGRPLVGTQLTNLLIHGSETKKDEEPDLDLQTQAFIHMAENALGDALVSFANLPQNSQAMFSFISTFLIKSTFQQPLAHFLELIFPGQCSFWKDQTFATKYRKYWSLDILSWILKVFQRLLPMLSKYLKCNLTILKKLASKISPKKTSSLTAIAILPFLTLPSLHIFTLYPMRLVKSTHSRSLPLAFQILKPILPLFWKELIKNKQPMLSLEFRDRGS
ncbi:Metaxin-2, variant 3 [Entomophthora muscae]|uniref:Metaxin-2, variant 3 n=1 Tax=Entomophthora muscae TaxID=34485 RepID=A0ACC2RKG5_9FUNG|nr:Metaxin-2, variant 3 [Entomophthora muscae]